MQKIIFLIQCNDSKGLLASISQYFFTRNFNILHCQQHSDTRAKRYYMRVELDMADLKSTRKELRDDFSRFAEPLKLTWECHFTDYKSRVAIFVSKTSHCLYDLISRQHEGDLVCDIPLIISNHPDLEHIAGQFRIPYYYIPIENGDKTIQEDQIRLLLKRHDIDLVVLARYMQILSPQFVEEWNGKIINIHHAFLPAFQGANPYARAYERGVKMIGATAHYASQDLDQGPIIEQDVVRVNHELTPDGLKQIGKDVERQVLSRAVQAHLEHRIIIYKNRTIVFSAER
ncbi:MAG: formyltetrahydrofolate deformylase [Sphaerochaetaceae bacterium]|jgi:formyltetrahydrofolate deformylase|nr:formyltetrahydrofolate deformylase [Sphaerochaetaceae bacterium]NLO61735.1 formyltetrahydrofolate deformylase [Spirochaetales bacterium]MDD2407144.1 formyltetrahydrofolate deformylase [Sphaerochaetaceae bacterium]MDD3670916.1 formyltetrahydrofolate deformylase [Sphaerochaetaceae bacterium]MDD4259211.1 formyltetrahydrofolate deformylase [Sphaerochaetaceae bacterium]